MRRVVVNYPELVKFMDNWPCHGFPDNLWSISFDFDHNGDLVDIEAWSDQGEMLYSGDFDGPALLALSLDAVSAYTIML
jgi:hypothetical protein